MRVTLFSNITFYRREPFLEDIEAFNIIKQKINKLINTFYNGDELSPFEREIERAYLTGKQIDASITNTNTELKKKVFFIDSLPLPLTL